MRHFFYKPSPFVKILCLILAFHLLAAEEDSFIVEPTSLDDPSFSLSSLEGEPSAIVHNCVNVLSGEYHHSQADLIVAAAEPLTLERFYSSSNAKLSDFQRVWKFNHDISVTKAKYSDPAPASFYFSDSFGSTVYFGYRGPEKHQMDISSSILKKRVVNPATREVNGAHNLKRLLLIEGKETILVKKGGHAEYKFTHGSRGKEKRVKTIQRSNGNLLSYDYRDEDLEAIRLNGPKGALLGELTFEGDKGENLAQLKVKSSTGQKVIYQFMKSKFYTLDHSHYKETGEKKYDKQIAWKILNVQSDLFPTEVYAYWEDSRKKPTEIPKIKRRSLPNHRFLEIDYYQKGNNEVWPGANYPVKEIRKGRVMRLSAPAGHDETPIPIYRFVYFLNTKVVNESEKDYRIWGETHVYNALDHLKIYHSNEHERLSKIEFFTGTKNRQKCAEEIYYWDTSSPENSGNLKSKVFLEQGAPLYCKQYDYSEKGELVGESLCGNLTGKNPEALTVDQNGQAISGERFFIGHEYTEEGLRRPDQIREFCQLQPRHLIRVQAGDKSGGSQVHCGRSQCPA